MHRLVIAALASAALYSGIVGARAENLIYKAEGVELEIKKGAFSANDRRAQQLLTIRNHSTVVISYVGVECGFFHGDLLIGRDTALVNKIEPSQDAYAELTAYVLSADRTDCRFTSVSTR